MTPCQVFVVCYPWETFVNNGLEKDCWNKFAFEAFLASVDGGGQDPIVYIMDKTSGKHIFGNHRWFMKEKYRRVKQGKDPKNHILILH